MGEEGPIYEQEIAPVWERSQGLRAFWGTFREVAFRPVTTFRRLPRETSAGPAILYLLIGAAVSGLLSFWVVGTLEEGGGAGAFGLGEVWIGLVGSLVGGLLGIALASALYHLALIVLGGRNAPYRATFRAIAYVNGAMAWIAWIPVLGWLGAWIWGIVLEVLALREVHQTTTGRAVVAVLAPLLVMLLVLGLLAALVLKLFLETKEKSPGLI